jgi:hypothetical protein
MNMPHRGGQFVDRLRDIHVLQPGWPTYGPRGKYLRPQFTRTLSATQLTNITYQKMFCWPCITDISTVTDRASQYISTVTDRASQYISTVTYRASQYISTVTDRASQYISTVTDRASQYISIMKPMWCTFHSNWESKASTCFEHYLLILKRRFTNGIWYLRFMVPCIVKQWE